MAVTLTTVNKYEVIEDEGPTNMIYNGDFYLANTGDEWGVPGGAWVLTSGSSGLATWDGLTGYVSLIQNESNLITPLSPNTSYTLEFDVTSAGYMELEIRSEYNAHTFDAAAHYATGHHVVTFTTPVTMTEHGIKFFATLEDGGTGGTLDNILLYPTP